MHRSVWSGVDEVRQAGFGIGTFLPPIDCCTPQQHTVHGLSALGKQQMLYCLLRARA
jgi:hypothetical protein